MLPRVKRSATRGKRPSNPLAPEGRCPRTISKKVPPSSHSTRYTSHMPESRGLACTHCGANYAANGSDIHLRKCPACQGGNPSTAGWTH